MKKVICVLLVLILALSILYSCTGRGEVAEFTKSLPDLAAEKVMVELRVYICIAYNVQEMPIITTSVQQQGANEYEVTGNVAFYDAKDGACSCSYTATATYLPEAKNFEVEYKLGTLHKSK